MVKNIIISVIVGALIIGAALYVKSNKDTETTPAVSVSAAQLEAANGKDNTDCWVAVDGIVYEIEQGFKWVDGEHTESAEAYCGADLSATIDRAPHGRTKLAQLKKIGTL